MKKYKKISYVLLIIIIVVLTFTVYAAVSKDNDKVEKEKRISEFKFLDSKLESLFNQLNNIEIKNYSVAINNITKKSDEEESSENNQESQSESKESNSKVNSGSNNNSSNNSELSKNQEKEFNLKNRGVLTNENEINWDNIKKEIEILYSSIPTITIDFHQTNINQDDILNFNKEFDALTTYIKNEDKKNSLLQLSKLYEYMPKFAQIILDDKTNKTIIETKNNVLKAYSKLDNKDWKDISNDIKQASNVFSKLLTDTDIAETKKYTISKIYVMINELQNAINLEDETIFLIKYKNIIEEMQLFSK